MLTTCFWMMIIMSREWWLWWTEHQKCHDFEGTVMHVKSHHHSSLLSYVSQMVDHNNRGQEWVARGSRDVCQCKSVKGDCRPSCSHRS